MAHAHEAMPQHIYDDTRGSSEHPHNAAESEVEEVRQGSLGYGVRYILAFSTGLAAGVLGILMIGAIS